MWVNSYSIFTIADFDFARPLHSSQIKVHNSRGSIYLFCNFLCRELLHLFTGQDSKNARFQSFGFRRHVWKLLSHVVERISSFDRFGPPPFAFRFVSSIPWLAGSHTCWIPLS